ncbi:hypothetical protein SCH01S_26_00020 [Sphingomonas changbaiensis NBRC 104936]|uniref:Nudix hydrolase domain-containing protein n=1 Tax=Sphingomonas changbaiensis NBRC 104936 TaxID=1219043 RepID=A0A0E9MNX8_9SPHN|nr:NUDIX hydrolase [Sphingomonas changbaiensis]GAO39131.1 hypothetical protein SCH01S_26_00020 [Sphingomonas changbaiensis NBRC 104936]
MTLDVTSFHGAKIALLVGDAIVTFLRDDKPDIDWPGRWDLPGGGREGDESVTECICREVMEEFGIAIDPANFIWSRVYPSVFPDRADDAFLVAPIPAEMLDQVRFGSEGQRWALVPVAEYLAKDDAVPHHQRRLRDYLHSRS